MYVTYCEEKSYEFPVMKTLELRFDDVLSCPSWSEFLHASRDASCSILETEDLPTRFIHRRLIRFCASPVLRPLVLVTVPSRDNARGLTEVCIDELVWVDRLEPDLCKAVRRAEGRSFLDALADGLDQRSTLPAQLRRAVRLAFLSPIPIRNQTELADLSYCDKRTLIRQWNRSRGREHATLKSLLDWILLIRCFELRELGAGWKSITADLDVSRRTIARTALRCTGRSVGDLDQRQVEAGFASSAAYRIVVRSFVPI